MKQGSQGKPQMDFDVAKESPDEPGIYLGKASQETENMRKRR